MGDDYKIKTLSIKFPKASKYVKSYHSETTQMYFLIEDDILLKKIHDVQNKVSNSIKKEFDSELKKN